MDAQTVAVGNLAKRTNVLAGAPQTTFDRAIKFIAEQLQLPLFAVLGRGGLDGREHKEDDSQSENGFSFHFS
uniref:Uncharacterized protein n=1 Tax=Romanomermis culicivorax TaxID=13658 RepID=A0A915I6B4_ROMCU